LETANSLGDLPIFRHLFERPAGRNLLKYKAGPVSGDLKIQIVFGIESFPFVIKPVGANNGRPPSFFTTGGLLAASPFCAAEKTIAFP